MITHDVTHANSGMEVSIMFEMDRPENPGAAFNVTMNFMVIYNLFALTVYHAVGSCSGPRIAMRGAVLMPPAPGL
ncbi:hypothetical protein EDD18DRAFT_1181197 [Armillaria luteobubalina]|nr:hypothetical protein EDD18DRAFT_1181197 [Armillaria luteobubalina]